MFMPFDCIVIHKQTKKNISINFRPVIYIIERGDSLTKFEIVISCRLNGHRSFCINLSFLSPKTKIALQLKPNKKWLLIWRVNFVTIVIMFADTLQIEYAKRREQCC